MFSSINLNPALGTLEAIYWLVRLVVRPILKVE